MKLKSVDLKEKVFKTKLGEEDVSGTMIFSNLAGKDILRMTPEEFIDPMQKHNIITDFSIARTGNIDDEIPNEILDFCKKVSLSNVKSDNLPLDNVDLSLGEQYNRNDEEKKVSRFMDYLHKMPENKKLELERDDSIGSGEWFTREFNSGNMIIEPSKRVKNKNTHFDVEINGCSWVMTKNENINDITVLFNNTIMKEVSLINSTKKYGKERVQLEGKLLQIKKTKKLPTKLFNMLPNRNRIEKLDKNTYIASVKDQQIYQIDD